MEYLLYFYRSIVQAKHSHCPVKAETLVVLPKQCTSKRGPPPKIQPIKVGSEEYNFGKREGQA
jgi:hypothetical protein